MNKPELLEEIRRTLGGTATTHAAELALQAVLRAMKDGLREDSELMLYRFGSFRIRQVQARRMATPSVEGERLLPARKVLRFTASGESEPPDKG